MLKVLFISGSYPIIGGVQRWLKLLYSELIKHNIEPIIALSKGIKYHNSVLFSKFNEMKYYEMDGTPGSLNARIFEVKRIIKLIRPDIIIPVLLHDPIIGAAICRDNGQRFHVVYPVHEHNTGAVYTCQMYFELFDKVVTVNKLLSDVIKTVTPIEKERINIIRCGVQSPQKKRALKEKRIRIAYGGRLVDKPKRVFDLPVILRLLHEYGVSYELSLIGEGEDSFELLNQLTEQIPNNLVKYLGRITSDEIYNDVFPNTDIILITSTHETGPLIAWEAMMNGVIPVTSRYRGLMREGILRNFENSMIFEVGEMSKAAEYIKTLVDDPTLLNTLSSNAKKTAYKYFTLDRMVNDWANLLWNLNEEEPLKLPTNKYYQKQCHSSRLEKYGIPPRVAFMIRKTFGKQVYPQNPTEEWPVYPFVPIENMKIISDTIHKLDNRDCLD